MSNIESLPEAERIQLLNDGIKKMMTDVGLKELELNTNTDIILDNVKYNTGLGHQQVRNYGLNGLTSIVVGGGWSLKETKEELVEACWRKDTEIIACNGAGNWLMEQNIKPDAVVVLDARPSNVRFIEEPIPGCKYLLASQCDPSLFEACADRDVRIFHCCSSQVDAERDFLNNYYANNWVHIQGTCCVGFRSIFLLRVLGYRYFELFGIDSCHKDDGTHHAYDQPENEGEPTIPISVGGRLFQVSAWQYVQALDFQSMARTVGHEFQLKVHGDGLIAHMIEHGSSLDRELIEAGLKEKIAAQGA